LLDPQGQAVEHALAALGFGGTGNVRVGKAIELLVEAQSKHDAHAQATAMCHKLLANPVTEDFLVEVEG
jgi:phosphoribosylformylglycinamidine synthase